MAKILIEGIRTGRKFDAKSVRGYALLIAGLNIVSLVALLATSHGGIDRFGHLVGSDFLSFWAVGRVLLEGGSPYDVAAHMAAMRQFADGLQGYPAFFYPPMFLLLCLLLGALPYFAALAAWLTVTGAAYLASARLWARKLGLDLPLWLWLTAFPPVLIVLTHGQTSFLVAALLGAGLLLVKDRPVLAGVLLGLATFKPQFGLLVPIALLLTGSWRTIFSAGATAIAIALITTLAFGPHVWADWYALSGSAQESMANGSIGYGKMVSTFAALKLLGASTGAAYAAQGVATLTVVGAVASASWKREWSPQIAALLVTSAPLATPFVLDYDMVLLAFPLLYLAGTGYRDWEKSVSALAFVAPVFARPLAINAGVPIMPLVLGLLFWVLWRRRETEE